MNMCSNTGENSRTDSFPQAKTEEKKSLTKGELKGEQIG